MVRWRRWVRFPEAALRIVQCVYKCVICSKEFERRAQLHGHVVLAHRPRTVTVEKTCPKCGKVFEVQRSLRRGQQVAWKKEPTFCGHRCANGRRLTDEWKANISSGLHRWNDAHKWDSQGGRARIECKHCHELFIPRNAKRQFCSNRCSIRNRYLHLSRLRFEKYRRYRKEAAFTFNVNDYREAFDLTLVEERGWYRPDNGLCKSNLSGVSKDHLVSVQYGFEHKIAPEILAHPTNCRVIPHPDNVAKGRRCCITVDELKERIAVWNEKYF